jgi:hypothetical protein
MQLTARRELPRIDLRIVLIGRLQNGEFQHVCDPQVRAQSSHEEDETIRVTHHPEIYEHDVEGLQALRVRLRQMRDKERSPRRQARAHLTFHETLKDIYYARKEDPHRSSEDGERCQSEDLQQAAFEKHEAETTDQVERLQRRPQ